MDNFNRLEMGPVRKKRRRSPRYNGYSDAERYNHGTYDERYNTVNERYQYSRAPGRPPSPDYALATLAHGRQYHTAPSSVDPDDDEGSRWHRESLRSRDGEVSYSRGTNPPFHFRNDQTSYQIPRSPPSPPPPKRTKPTDHYLSNSLRPSWKLDNPTQSRKLIVLDLNGSLLLRSPHQQKQGYALSSHTRPLRTVYTRPYLAAFTSYIFHKETRKWLDTMIWSSAQPHSVRDMVEKCFQGRRNEFKAIWARDTLGLTQAEYHNKSQTLKDLDKPWADKEIFPNEHSRHSALTTLLVDDSPCKAVLQPWNHLCISEYDQEMRKWDLGVAEWETAYRRAKEAREAVEKEQEREQERRAKEALEFEMRKEEEERRIEEAVDDPNVTKVIKEVVMVNGKMIGEQKLVKKVVKEVVMVNGEMIDERSEETEDVLEGEKPLTKQQKKRKSKRLAKKEAIRKAKDELEQEALLVQAEFAEVEEGEISPEDLLRAQESEEAQLDALRDKMVCDETLLAVIGILDHIKYEGNVAGWMRSGGLRRIDVSEEMTLTAKRSGSPPTTPSPKRRRMNDKSKLAFGDDNVSPPSTPPLSSPQDVRPSSAGQQSSPLQALMSGPLAESEGSSSPGSWFERPAVMRFWANQGRRALKELTIEAVSGVKDASVRDKQRWP